VSTWEHPASLGRTTGWTPDVVGCGRGTAVHNDTDLATPMDAVPLFPAGSLSAIRKKAIDRSMSFALAPESR